MSKSWSRWIVNLERGLRLRRSLVRVLTRIKTVALKVVFHLLLRNVSSNAALKRRFIQGSSVLILLFRRWALRVIGIRLRCWALLTSARSTRGRTERYRIILQARRQRYLIVCWKRWLTGSRLLRDISIFKRQRHHFLGRISRRSHFRKVLQYNSRHLLCQIGSYLHLFF